MLSGAPTPSRASKAASRTAPAGFSHGNGASHAHPAGGRRKLPPIHSNPRNARVERPAHGGIPAYPRSARKRQDRPVMRSRANPVCASAACLALATGESEREVTEDETRTKQAA
jgi:hypothetical protein